MIQQAIMNEDKANRVQVRIYLDLLKANSSIVYIAWLAAVIGSLTKTKANHNIYHSPF